MLQQISLFVLIASLEYLNAINVHAHGGRLDSNGGHTGNDGYHCHKCTQKTPEYNRHDWKHWADIDKDCLNTRQELLLEQSTADVILTSSRCTVYSGEWFGPYSARTFTLASDVDIDHIIPLKWAFDHGGDLWSPELKQQFANDPSNLLIVDDALNQSKGAQSPMEWMPPNKSFHCEYLEKWQAVLRIYPLELSDSEKSELAKLQTSC